VGLELGFLGSQTTSGRLKTAGRARRKKLKKTSKKTNKKEREKRAKGLIK